MDTTAILLSFSGRPVTGGVNSYSAQGVPINASGTSDSFIAFLNSILVSFPAINTLNLTGFHALLDETFLAI